LDSERYLPAAVDAGECVAGDAGDESLGSPLRKMVLLKCTHQVCVRKTSFPSDRQRCDSFGFNASAPLASTRSLEEELRMKRSGC
jgi:hypothetical protein